MEGSLIGRRWGRPRPISVALWLTLLLALWLRLTGIGFGLPSLYHPDEPSKLEAAAAMVRTGDLNPHYFSKPTIVIYLNALVGAAYVAGAKLDGTLASAKDFASPIMLEQAVGHTDFPGVVRAGRTLLALVGCLVVLLTFLVGRRYLEDERSALLAALCVAVSPGEVRQSHFIETNILLSAALVLVCWAALRVFERGTTRDYALAGYLVGIAASCKYTGALGGLFPLAAHLLAPGRKWFSPRALVCGLLFPVGFFSGSPYALVDFSFFLGSVRHDGSHYAHGHAGSEGSGFWWYLRYAAVQEGPLLVLSLAALYLLVRHRDRRLLVLASFPVLYFVFISSFVVRNEQTFLPIVPFAFLLGSSYFVRLVDGAKRLAFPKRRVAVMLLGAFAFLSVGVPLRRALARDRELSAVDGRELARRWIMENVPPGTRIALESYSPFLPPSRYDVSAFRRLGTKSADWLVKERFRYVIFSSGEYGRFFNDPERYESETTAYSRLWRRFPLVRRFKGGEVEIRIHQIPETTPSKHRPTPSNDRQKRG